MPPPTQEDREQRLDEVLASYLQALKEGAAPGRQELLDSHPDLAGDLADFFADQDRFDRLAAPLRAVVPGPRLKNVRNFGDYEILEEIARGGMGVVFKAWQKSLGRVVALKMLLAGPWASAADLHRFRTEAEAAAQLDHPNIVPIHEVGTHDGHPYLSMKLIEGGNLARAVADRRGPIAPKEAAKLLAVVADAVHYAHQRGILHRDLKPANVLLALHTEANGDPSACTLGSAACVPMIADFGLAKRTPRAARPEAPASRGDFSARPTLPLPQVLTHTGAILGTPGYMAPEQASGSPAAVTTAADVYGLGAILYELLTGRPPFRGETPLDTVRQVIEQDPVRPGVHNSAVNRDLETICLKCLRKEPAKRYASARDVADDLRRYLHGEPILARPVGPAARLWRLARRQPAIAALSAALVLAVLVGLSGVTALWLHAEGHARRAEEHFRAAELQRDRARDAWELTERSRQETANHLEDSERSFKMAHQAVHDYCRRVSEELRDAPNLQPLRKALLQDALNYYQSFLHRRGQDPALRRELADTYQSMGRVTAAIGARADARKAHAEALAIYRELQQDDPDNVELQRKFAASLNSLATLTDTSEEAFVRFTEARDAYRRFLEANPNDRVLRAGLGITLNNLGAICQRTGRPEGRDWFQKARSLQEKLLADNPADPASKVNLANTLANYAVMRGHEAGGREDALLALQRARDLRQELAKARPRDAGARADLAASHLSLGIALRDAGKLDEAFKALQQAHAMRQTLARDNPFVTRYQADVAAALINLGVLHSRQKHKDRALECYEKARDIQEKLVKADPDNQATRRDLGMSYFNIGTVHGALDRRPQEGEALDKARDIQEKLVKTDPNNLEFRADLGRTLNNLAWNRMALKRLDEAPPLAREAVRHLRLALERAPRVLTYRQMLNSNYGTLGEAEARLGHTAAAAEALTEREKLWPAHPGELYRIARELALVAEHVGRGKAERTPDEQAERRRHLEHALAVLRQAIAHGFRDHAHLQQDKAFDPLRMHEGFRELTRELEKQAHPPQKQPPSKPTDE